MWNATREGGWLVRFFFEHGETDGMAQHSKVYLVLGLFEPARELFLTKMQPRRVCSMPTFSNFLRNIFCRLCGTIGVLCLSFQDSWRARRLFSTWWLRVVVHKHGMCLDGIWLFQLLWLQFLMSDMRRMPMRMLKRRAHYCRSLKSPLSCSCAVR